jgi:small-conductance mechanosensitive channel
MRYRLTTLLIALWALAAQSFALVEGRTLTKTLKDLNDELRMSYEQRAQIQQTFDETYEAQHQRMLDAIQKTSELSILLFTQEPDMTFDMAYALKKATADYSAFNQDRRPYDRIIYGLNYEVERYARLIEALRRLPPVMKEIEVEIVPDSLLYHNDSLDVRISQISSELEKEVIHIAVKDSASAPFCLDAEGELYRDSCIRYSSELLKMHADNRAIVLADSIHYQEAYWRMEEAYDYAGKRYADLSKYVFIDGQTPFLDIVRNWQDYWGKTKKDLHDQYDFYELIAPDPVDSTTVDADAAAKPEKKGDALSELSSKGVNSLLVLLSVFQLVALAAAWLVVFIILLLVYRFVKSVQRFLPRKKLPLFSVLVGTFLYFLVIGYGFVENPYIQLGAHNLNMFLWLLIVISGSLLLRVKPEQITRGIMMYLPALLIALIIIFSRNSFVPDSLLVLLFPPILFLSVLRQAFVCIHMNGKTTTEDSTLGWISLLFYLMAFVAAFLGYTFFSLMIIVWWYCQLAVLLTVLCATFLMDRYKERRLEKHINNMRERITYVGGDDRESLLFGATWFFDLIREVIIPVVVILSLPMCIHLSLGVFDFNDLFNRIYTGSFVLLTDDQGVESLRISFQSIVNLLILFFALRYLNRAIHFIWQYLRYAAFMRRYKRQNVLANEVNMSLGNSIITVLVWTTYAVSVVVVWNIPTGSLGLIAGGLSAGIGLAMKDIINNFIYGIQLMGGRLRVGDWIECDGVRGKVTSINYQCVQVETIDYTEMSFLNASLFGKNFNNLTRNHSYEMTKLTVGVAYGTDVDKAREVLVNAMQQMRTKDRYGREIVDPKTGIYVIVDNMADSAVVIGVKQMVLVAERIKYVERAKEVMYKALNDAGITIAFPQLDVHMVQEDKHA